MPYTTDARDMIAQRVGWAPVVQPTTIVLDGHAMQSDSGRYFVDFHAMATAENVSATLSTSSSQAVSLDTLNDKLNAMKTAAAAKVLDAVFNLNGRAQRRRIPYSSGYADTSATVWDTVIQNRSDLFDTAMGLQGAVDALELQLTSSRSNLTERSVKASTQLFEFLNGAYDPNAGKFITTGLKGLLSKAIADLIDILFPQPVNGPYLQNASYKW